MAWFGISAGEYDSCCGGAPSLLSALNGIGIWSHLVREPHWFILDLKNTYLIDRARGRSFSARDPTWVEIFTSTDKIGWIPVSIPIVTWQDTNIWQEVPLTQTLCRYIKIVVQSTEDFQDWIDWGNMIFPQTIIDFNFAITPPIDGRSGSGWELVSIQGTGDVNLANLQVLYNGTYYTWAQATTNANEEGEPLILAFVYGWSFTNQVYTTATSINSKYGYWVYWYHYGELYVDVGTSDDGNIVLIKGRQMS